MFIKTDNDYNCSRKVFLRKISIVKLIIKYRIIMRYVNVTVYLLRDIT